MESTLEKLRKRDLYDGYEYYYKLKSLIKSGNGGHDIRSLPEYKLLATVNPHLAEALAIENDIVSLKFSSKFSMNGSYGNNNLDIDVLRDRVKLQTQIRKLKLKRNMELNKAKARWDYISTMHAWRRRRVKEVVKEMPKKLANKVNNAIAGLIAMGVEKTSVPRRMESIVKDEMEKILRDLKEGES